MILFVGEQDKGWFVPETAEKKNEKCEYSGFVSRLFFCRNTPSAEPCHNGLSEYRQVLQEPNDS